MVRPFVKICGMTREADAALAAALGADAIGFVFWPRSPRAISPDAAAAIARTLPPHVRRAGVFVDTTPDEVATVVRHVALDIVQLHGDDAAERFADLVDAPGAGSPGPRRRVTLWKSVSVDTDADVQDAIDLGDDVVPLVDATDRERRGGTGRTADWPRAARVASRRPVVLAGGLNAGNVAAALVAVRPWGVDVSSGVETAPGVKSAARLREFFAALSGARAEAQ